MISPCVIIVVLPQEQVNPAQRDVGWIGGGDVSDCGDNPNGTTQDTAAGRRAHRWVGPGSRKCQMFKLMLT